MSGKGKRKAQDSDAATTSKKVKNTKPTTLTGTDHWPDDFISLLKIYKALNTVLAFCSTRKALATTFSVVRTSVENIIKRPLELSSVAEIKALLPDIVRFAYIPANDHRINDNSVSASSDVSTSRSKYRREPSPDLYELKKPGEDSDHVLVMEFVEAPSGSLQKQKMNSAGYYAPSSLTPQQVKNLIEKRNARFITAVNECIFSHPKTAKTGEDPVLMLQKAGQDHIPINPAIQVAPPPSAAFLTPHSSPSKSASQALRMSVSPTKVPSAATRPSIVSIIDEIESQDSYKEQILSRRVFDERKGRWGQLDRELPKEVEVALKEARSVEGFYTHQADAINAFWKGKNVVVSTATASGKSIIYQALAQDQKSALVQLLTRTTSLSNANVYTYDGDTPKEARQNIRDTASVIFTNFDTIHASILPGEDRWRRFLKGLRLVVVDELHYYSGLMGSHVALVMRRFRRVCTAVGNRRIRFISCSATISNPAKHMKSIFGIEDIEVVTDDGSPAGRKDFLLWQPPLVDEVAPELGRVRSILEACALFIFLMKRGVRTIVFCKIRRTCEMFMKMVRADLMAEGRSDIATKVRAYRGGYSQSDRRAIEAEAFAGELLGIVATNALELGVDIGSLDAVISLGFPFSLASFRQQSGRAGRRSRDSLSVLVSDSLPADRHFVANPDDIFDKPTEDLIVDVENRVILEGHVQCAAHEMPIHIEEDAQYFGDLLAPMCNNLTRDAEGWYHTHTKYLPYPAKHVALRGAREDKYTIIDITNADKPDGRSRVLEEIELSRALFEAYEGGVFMHQGHTYVVKEVSHDERTARIIRSDVNWITRPRNIDPTQTYRIREIRGSPHRAYFGSINLKTVIFGFFKLRNNTILDAVDLETPPYERDSTGMWVDVPKATLEGLFQKGRNPAEGIHSAQHAVLSLTPLYSLATAQDIRTECKVAAKEGFASESSRKRPGRLIFYDAAGPGGGVCAKAFDHMTDLLEQALDVIEKCRCEDDEGCAACVKMASCKESNAVASKIGALLILRAVLGRPIDWEDVPYAENFAMNETVVAASAVKTLGEVQVERDVKAET
ncbi:P-loop containing nucleoside triphosphate hydrolase protein [Clavulina sp. PMI_390]|nr:P-loop containing nucleoside triphosphate hydrolase protein [Clavulina sp. PMI_390]